jgi:hypothetical protein
MAINSFSNGNFINSLQAAGKNAVINGGMDIWQRGTSFAAAVDTAFCADRWQTTRDGTTVNLTATQDTSIPNNNTKYSLKFQQVTTGATSLVQYAARQLIENSNILPLLGKSVTLSFWYRSNKTGSHGYRVLGNYNTGGTDQASTFTVNAADTWEYKTIAITAFSAVSAVSASPTATGGLVDIGFRVNGQGFTTLSTNDYFQISQVQLELGTTATTFSRAGGTIQGELAACQRYYQKSYDTGTAPQTNSTSPGGVMAVSGNIGVSGGLGSVPLKVEMRTAPTVTIYSYTASTAARVSDNSGADLAANSGVANYIGTRSFNVQNLSAGTINAAFNGFLFHYVASSEL